MHPLSYTAKSIYDATPDREQKYPNQAVGEANLKQLFGDDFENLIAETTGIQGIFGSDIDQDIVSGIAEWDTGSTAAYLNVIPFSEDEYEATIARRVDEYIVSSDIGEGRTAVFHVVVTGDSGEGVMFYQIV